MSDLDDLRKRFPYGSMVGVQVIPTNNKASKPIIAVFATLKHPRTRGRLVCNVSSPVARVIGWNCAIRNGLPCGVLVHVRGNDIRYTLVAELANALYGRTSALSFYDVADADNFV